jgi:hypothetical protein
MYCSTCGVAVAPGLTYCNYCGAKLSGKEDKASKPSGPKPEMLVSAMVVVFVIGLAAISMLLGVMKAILQLETGQILAFALLSFLIMIALEGVIIRLLFRRRRDPEPASDAVRLPGHTTNELDAAQARALPEPLPSVTEHTTRAFEPIFNDRASK